MAEVPADNNTREESFSAHCQVQVHSPQVQVHSPPGHVHYDQGATGGLANSVMGYPPPYSNEYVDSDLIKEALD